MLAQWIIFGLFALSLLFSAMMVLISRNPVKGALWLVLSFVSAAGIWLFLQAEFLSLVLILVYVGAVMTLFLFVVMMMNLDQLPDRREAFKRYLPWALGISGLLSLIFAMSLKPGYFTLASIHSSASHAQSNVEAIGNVLYTQYVYAFELAAVILLAAIIGAISLTFRGAQPNTRKQRIEKQIATRREDSVKLLKITSGNRTP